MTPSKRLPGLDTLRALAILLVMPFHAWIQLQWPSLRDFFGRWGWIGVDLFFVLSGFLIGSQLLEGALREGRVNLGRFYLKRSFRILPCFWVVLLLYCLCPAFRESSEWVAPWRFLLFVINFHPKGGSFSHAWSLCVEEHFYLIFPCLVAFYRTRGRWLNPRIGLLLVLVAEMALRCWLFLHNAPFHYSVYRPTYTHLDGLVVGVGLALMRVHREDLWHKLLSHPRWLLVSGLALLAGGLVIYPIDDKGLGAYVFTFTLISLGFGCLVAAAQAPNFWLAETHIPGASLLATLAFTLYLTHKQMIHLAIVTVGDADENPGQTVVLAVLYSLAASVLLHLVVERPFLKLRGQILNRD